MVIVTRQGQGSDGRVWVTFSGARVTTAVMTNEDTERLVRCQRREGRASEVSAIPARRPQSLLWKTPG